MMNIYLVKIPEEFVDWDWYAGFVIAAETIEKAKQIAVEFSANTHIWQTHGTATLLANDAFCKEGIVLYDFNAG